jgi:hypothetical protein
MKRTLAVLAFHLSAFFMLSTQHVVAAQHRIKYLNG